MVKVSLNKPVTKSVLTQKEGQYFDRKSARIQPKDILKHLVAFANAGGGRLVIGVEDDGTVSGFTFPKAHSQDEFRQVISLLRDTPLFPKFEVLEVESASQTKEEVLVISVDASTNKVIKSYDGQVYLRYGDQTSVLNHEQITQLEYDKGQRSFEDEIISGSSLDDIDEMLMQKYRGHMDVDASTQDILQARHMYIDRQLTKAAVLLFSKNPTKYLPQARVKFIRYDGVYANVGKNINIIKEKTFDDAIPHLIIKLKEFILTQLREFQYLDENGQFSAMPEYPEFAWFEGIVNALTHRNYSIAGDHIRVVMFDDRIEIDSPGLLPNIVTIENIRERRYSRNPRIARVLSEFGWVKEMNEGVKRIYNEMERYFLRSPVYSEPHNNVLLVLENNILNRQFRINDRVKALLQDGVYNSLNDMEKRVVSYAFASNKVRVTELANVLDKSSVTTRSILKKLCAKGILEWYGTSNTDPKQYYYLKNIFE